MNVSQKLIQFIKVKPEDLLRTPKIPPVAKVSKSSRSSSVSRDDLKTLILNSIKEALSLDNLPEETISFKDGFDFEFDDLDAIELVTAVGEALEEQYNIDLLIEEEKFLEKHPTVKDFIDFIYSEIPAKRKA